MKEYKRLIDNYINGDSDTEEFIDAFSKLWRQNRDEGVLFDTRFQRIVDRIFTSCDCYSDNPEGPIEISEKEFKNEIQLLSYIWWG